MFRSADTPVGPAPDPGGLVLGPLPPLHRLVVSLVALLVCAAASAWLAFVLSTTALT
jgi:hypothetical protein